MTAKSIHPLPIAVLISGGGTTLRNLIERIKNGQLQVDIRIVISSNPAAAGLEFSRAANISTLVVQRGDHDSTAAFSDAVFRPCREAGARLVVMGGFLKHILIPADFFGRTACFPSCDDRNVRGRQS